MHDIITAIDCAIKELENLKKILERKKVSHVNTAEERDLIKATSYSWLKTYQSKINVLVNNIDISAISNMYCDLLNYSEKRTKRNIFVNSLKNLKKSLIALRSDVLMKISTGEVESNNAITIPDFSVLISDQKMISIINKRWIEIDNCLNAEAPLSATVMMGGLLESVLMARVNKIEDKSILFKQRSTPKDGKTGKPKQLSDWMLKDFIDVLNEIKIISSTSAEFSRLIRDYRNYIHPEKELRRGESISISDAKLFWVTTVSLINQLLIS